MKKQHRNISGRVQAFKPVIRGNNRLEINNSGAESEISILGSIGKSWWDDSGITEKEVRDAIKSVPKGKKIKILVNSDGGSVKEGLGIYNAIKERSADITCHVVGYALSIASVFPLAAGKVVSPKSAIWMMHKAWVSAQGNADEMLACAEMLNEHDQMLAEIYSEATGKPISEMSDAMSKETWIRGSAAVEFGLADESDDESPEPSAEYQPRNLNRLTNVPDYVLNAARISAPPKGAEQPNPTATPQPAGHPNQNTLMNKAIIVALLKRHGIEALESETEAQLQAKLDKITPAPAPATTPAVNADVTALNARFEKERRARITAEVTRRAENRVENANLPWWIENAMEDEEGTLAQLDNLALNSPGGDPISGLGIQIIDTEASRGGIQGGRPTDALTNIYAKHTTPMARHDALKADWGGLMRDALARDMRGNVMAANTYSATLITNFLITGAITQLVPRFAAFNVFTRDNSVDPYKPRATGVLKFSDSAVTGSSVLTNATNFETGDATVDPVSITVNQYSCPRHVTNDELNSGLRMEDLMVQQLADFAAKTTQVVCAPITAANFTGTPLISAPGTFGFSDLQTLWGQLKKSLIHNAVLDGEYIARIMNVPTIFQRTGVKPGTAWAEFGWDNIAMNNDWTAADANVRGFACNPQAIGIITGLPLTPPQGIPGNTINTSTLILPDVNVAIAVNSWFSLSSRTFWTSYDMMLGAAKLDPIAGFLIKSA